MPEKVKHGKSSGWRRWSKKAFRTWLTRDREDKLDGMSYREQLYYAFCAGADWRSNQIETPTD